jgi:hypothetical protein
MISGWTLTVEAVAWDTETNSAAFQAVVDTANWLNVFSEPLAAKINSQFNAPTGKFNKFSYYAVNCDVTPPSNFGIQIKSKMFSVDTRDMIWRDFSG